MAITDFVVKAVESWDAVRLKAVSVEPVLP